MSENIRVGGNVNIKVGGTTRWYAKGGVEINSNGCIDYFAPKYTYGDPLQPPVKIVDGAVKEIELLTTLDLGSANDKSGTTQPGMLFGNTYHFRVKSYVKNPPANLLDINWMLKYHSPSQNKWLEIPLTAKGDSVKITLNDEDMCGRFVYVRAYVNDPEKEGEYKEWKHNRFRWFDRMIVHDQINDRVIDPWKIDQGGSSLCGMAVLYYAMIKRDPQAYEKLAKELFRTGEYAIGTYVLKPHEKALSMYETKTTDSNYKATRMQAIDWIVLATTRSKESLNNQFVYNGFEDGNIDMLKAVNWPEMLTRMCKEVAGFSNVKSHGLSFNDINNKKRIISARIHDYFSNSDLEELQEIDRLHTLGKTILLMIDSDMIYNKSNYNSLVSIGNNSHWIVYEGGLQFFDDIGAFTSNLDKIRYIKFRIFTWGEDIQNSRLLKLKTTTGQGLTVESFKSNYYGYIEAN